ncbi:unnamed protein product [Discosporangium mesarthrocarpum]
MLRVAVCTQKMFSLSARTAIIGRGGQHVATSSLSVGKPFLYGGSGGGGQGQRGKTMAMVIATLAAGGFSAAALLTKDFKEKRPETLGTNATTLCENIGRRSIPLERLDEAYILQDDKPLGNGQFGKVTTAIHKISGEVVAVKSMRQDKVSEMHFLQEVETHREAGEHPNIVKLKGVYAGDNHWYMVMELAGGGELYHHLTRKGMMGDMEVRGLVRELTDAMMHLHDRGIVHFDIKPENILLGQASPACSHEGEGGAQSDGEGGAENAVSHGEGRKYAGYTASCTGSSGIEASERGSGGDKEAEPTRVGTGLLADFGSSFRLGGSGGSKVALEKEYTLAYSAPEVICAGPVDQKADVWSLGVITYIMLKGTHPFDPTSQANEDEIKANVIGACPNWEGVDPLATALLSRMLAPNPADRPSAREVLESPWLQQLGQDL